MKLFSGKLSESELVLFHLLSGHRVYYQAQRTKPEKYLLKLNRQVAPGISLRDWQRLIPDGYCISV